MTTKTISTICYIVATVLFALTFLDVASLHDIALSVAGLFFISLGLVFGSV